MFTGMGWNGLGVALHNSPHLIQIVDVIGVAGLAFLPVYVTCAAVSTVVRLSLEIGKGPLRPRLDFISAMCLIVLVLTYGVQTRFHHTVDDPVELKALLVQGNVSMSIRNDMSRSPAIFPLYDDLTSPHLADGYDLVIWPETPLPYPSFDERTVNYLNGYPRYRGISTPRRDRRGPVSPGQHLRRLQFDFPHERAHLPSTRLIRRSIECPSESSSHFAKASRSSAGFLAA